MVWATNDTNQANNLFNSLTTSSAVHWSDNEVNPQMSANRMLENDYQDVFFPVRFSVSGI